MYKSDYLLNYTYFFAISKDWFAMLECSIKYKAKQ